MTYVTITHIENCQTNASSFSIVSVMRGLRETMGDKLYSKFLPLDLNLESLEAMKAAGLISMQVIDYPLPEAVRSEKPPLKRPRAARAAKQPRRLKQETLDNLTRLGTEGKTTPEGAKKLRGRVVKRESEIVKDMERRERKTKRNGSKKR